MQCGRSRKVRLSTAALCFTLPHLQESSPPLVIHGDISRGLSHKPTFHLAPGLSKKKLSSPDARTLLPQIRKQSAEPPFLTHQPRLPLIKIGNPGLFYSNFQSANQHCPNPPNPHPHPVFPPSPLPNHRNSLPWDSAAACLFFSPPHGIPPFSKRASAAPVAFAPRVYLRGAKTPAPSGFHTQL